MSTLGMKLKRKRPVKPADLRKLAATLRELADEFDASAESLGRSNLEVDGSGMPATAIRTLRGYALNVQKSRLMSGD